MSLKVGVLSLRLLITGGRGQLGVELCRCLRTMEAEIGRIPEEYRDAQVDCVGRDVLDVTDEKSVITWFESHEGYDVVINCAAATNVDGCEVDENAALLVNSCGVRHLARAAELQCAKFVQVSTDYVFSGDDSASRKESDLANPVSAYGRTKLLGERNALEFCTRAFVVRTAWLYGYTGKNFVKTMRRLGGSVKRITVVNDQVGNPTNANDLAYEILKIALTENYGIYHCTNEGTCSWYDFAQAIMALSKIDCEVLACSSDEYARTHPGTAKRPMYSSLRNKHLEDTIGNEMRPWPIALETFLMNLPELEG